VLLCGTHFKNKMESKRHRNIGKCDPSQRGYSFSPTINNFQQRTKNGSFVFPLTLHCPSLADNFPDPSDELVLHFCTLEVLFQEF
jgi:hypothetical protein